MIARVERRLQEPLNGLEYSKRARLLGYLVLALRRMSARRRTLLELSFAYIAVSVCVSAAAHLSDAILCVGAVAYLAFGYMIWTVLEQPATIQEGSGYRLLAAPSRWRRHGVAFLHGAGAIALTALFALIWFTVVILVVTIATSGKVHVETTEFAQTQVPVLIPAWSALFILPLIAVPVALVHRRLFRNLMNNRTASHPLSFWDRLVWNAVGIGCIVLYMQMRGVFLHMPHPFGQICSSALALLLTITTAACELNFTEENAHLQTGNAHATAH